MVIFDAFLGGQDYLAKTISTGQTDLGSIAYLGHIVQRRGGGIALAALDRF
ncbi:unnamed protein product [Acidithrix sp. C25]|nr:unnamed protein product [Acidithrix sp. C25]